MSIGKYTYGTPIVHEWGEKTKLVIGKFCSIAKNVNVYLGGNHRTDWVTTYPFGHIHKSSFTETDYDFWAVIFEDETNKPLNRVDLLSEEINRMLNDSDQFIKIWRTFDTIKKPSKWIVWPHSESKGWLNKIENKL